MSSTPERSDRGTKLGLRVAAACALVGTIVHGVAGSLHGALTAGTDQSSAATVFRHVLETPAWGPVNILMLLATLAWLAVFVAITELGPEPRAAWLGRLAPLALAIGIAAATPLYLTDALAIPNLAEQWASADPAQQAQLVATGSMVQNAIRVPLFYTMPVLLFGLPFAVFGFAHANRASLVPTWVAALAGVAGVASFLMGASWTLGSNLVPEVVLWAIIQPMIWVWGIATGIALLRHSARHSGPARGAPAPAL